MYLLMIFNDFLLVDRWCGTTFKLNVENIYFGGITDRSGNLRDRAPSAIPPANFLHEAIQS